MKTAAMSFVLAVCLGLLPGGAAAATITVNTTAQSPGNPGDCTLGEAIQAANTNAPVDGCTAGSGSPTVDVIVVPAGTYALTVADPHGVTSGLPSITSPMSIEGASATTTIIERDASASSFRIFYVSSSGSLTLTRSTVRGGLSGVRHAGAVVLSDCVFSHNDGAVSADIEGVSISITNCTFSQNGFGVANAGTASIAGSLFDGHAGTAISFAQSFLAGSTGLTITNTRITNNQRGVITAYNKGSSGEVNFSMDHSVVSGNGATLPAGSHGGGLHLFAGRITNSVITNNRATHGAGVAVGFCCGANNFGGLLQIENSTISGNVATENGGGVYRTHLSPGVIEITNSTISGNVARFGGGVHGFGSIKSSTVVFNHAFGDDQRYGEGGGLYGGGSILNSIVAGNTTSPATLTFVKSAVTQVSAGAPLIYTIRVVGRNWGADCAGHSAYGFPTSLGYNLIGDGAGCITATTGDQVGSATSPIDPRIGQLTHNAIGTFTHPLATDSPARNAGNPLAPGSGGDACPATDQRGVARTEGGRCDIGAHEGATATSVVDSAQALVLTDPLPAGLFLESVSTTRGTCTSGQTVVCNLGPLGYGSEAVVTIVTRAKNAGTITNTASLRRSNSSEVVGTTSAVTTVVGSAHLIEGIVSSTAGGPIAGTLVNLTGAETRSATTTASGQYQFVVPAGGSYTVTPSRIWHVFSPANASFSNLSADVTAHFVGAPDTGVLLGAGRFGTEGGWFNRRGGLDSSFASETWSRLPWDSYNASGGGTRPALGDLDGDGYQEVVLGLETGGNGWFAVLDDARGGYPLATWLRIDWAAYNAANGETFPAVGNIDGDAPAEIVVGLGEGGAGWFAVFDDASTNYAFLGWRQVQWREYAGGHGATHPAVGDVDGDGIAEIVIGLGQGSAGWLEVFDGAPTAFRHRAWLQVPWHEYNIANGTTWPAAGDVDGDGRAEVIVGLGRGGRGYLAAFDDASAGLGFQFTEWISVAWNSYVAHVGETHPAIGNIDNDAAEELLIGFAEFPGEGGWVQIRDDAMTHFSPLAWIDLGWEAFRLAGGAVFPAAMRPR